MKKRITLLLAIIMLLTALPMNTFANGGGNNNASSPVTTRFADVPSTHWANSAIMQLVAKGALSGYPDGTFRPNGLVTRSEFAVMMTRALDIPLVTNPSQTFVDVGRNAWDFVYVETAKPYLTGYKQGNDYYFKGNESAVREDMAVALVRATGLENQQVDVNELKTIFKDYNNISPNLQKYVLIAYKNDLISGYPDGTFGGQRSITRAESAALLVRVLSSDAMEKVTFDTIVTTSAASDIKSNSARLNGSFANNSEMVEYGFYWGTTSNPTTKVIKGTSYAGPPDLKHDFTYDLTGLIPNTTYYFIAYAGTDKGELRSFTTPAVGGVTVSTYAASNIKGNSVTLNGSFENNEGPIEYGFYWGTTNPPETKSAVGLNLATSSLSFSRDLINLEPNTTYYFMAYAGESNGAVQSFKTSPFGVSTYEASAIKTNSAMLNGWLENNGSKVEYGFYWGRSSYPINKVVAGTSSATSVGFTYDLTGLTSGTPYYFVAYVGESKGVVQRFETLDTRIATSTYTAASVNSTSAALNGSFINNNDSTVEYGFYWGTTDLPKTKAVKGTSSSSVLNFTYDLTNLTPNTTYYFSAYAGGFVGEVLSFRTTAAGGIMASTYAASDIKGNSATLNGSFENNNSTVQYGFYWGTTSNPTTKVVNGTNYVGPIGLKRDFTYDLTGLAPNTTYYFRAYAGGFVGEVISFTTPPVASLTVITGTAMNIVDPSRLLSGAVSMDGSFSNNSGTVEYGFYTGTTLNPANKIVVGKSNSAALNFTFDMVDLVPRTTIYYRAFAGTAVGEVRAVLVFESLRPFSASANAASYITSTSGTIYGSFDGNRETVEYGFYWGTTNYPTTKIAKGTSNASYMDFSHDLTGLEPDTTYYFRTYAGTAQSPVMSFKTPPFEEGTSIKIEAD